MYSLLTDWYGSERAKTEITAYTPEAVAVGNVADKILQKTVSPDLFKTIKIAENWEKIAGPQIAGISSPLNLKRKILYVEVNNSVWLRELAIGPAKEMLLKKINELFGEKYCANIKFIPGGR